jgi:hypothetical protein
MSHHDHPIPDSYWVAAGRFLAGEYPGARSQDDAIAKLNQLLDAGVTHFIDLTEAGEYGLLPYADLAQQIGRLRGCKITHHRLPIRDMSAPNAATMRYILEAVNAALDRGDTIYVHCFWWDRPNGYGRGVLPGAAGDERRACAGGDCPPPRRYTGWLASLAGD